MSRNDITGDEIKSKILSKQGEENWDRIFGKKEKEPSSPQSLEAAYQRIEIDDGYTFSEEGLFEENKQYYKEMREAYKNINDKLEEKYKIMEPLCNTCGNYLKDVLDCNKNSCPKNEET
jgi:hypothetical protein